MEVVLGDKIKVIYKEQVMGRKEIEKLKVTEKKNETKIMHISIDRIIPVSKKNSQELCAMQKPS